MKTIELSMSPDYVKHWGLWEALRELLQNALDAQAKGHTMEVYDYNEHGANPTLRIRNSGPALDRSSLLLGHTTKRKDESQIGQFGEGFKLALLVLCRLGYTVNIYTGNEMWTPCLRQSKEFGCEVLNIDITERVMHPSVASSDGVEFSISGASTKDLQKKYHPILPLNRPIKDLPGQMFIHGLFICEAKEFKYGYNFSAGRVKLDRDRGMIDGFDLAYETGRIWTTIDRSDPDFGDDTLSKLIEEKAADVRCVEYHIPRASSIETQLVSSYTRRYRDAIPVSTQGEIKQAMAAGRKFQLVPDSLKTILWRAVGFFIPTVGTPAQRLNKFISKHKDTLTTSQVSELQDILTAMGDDHVEGEVDSQPA